MPITVTFTQDGKPAWFRIEPDAAGNLFLRSSSLDHAVACDANEIAIHLFEAWVAGLFDPEDRS